MSKFEYLRSINADYIDELFANYSRDPNSVDDSWRYFFEGIELASIPKANGKSNGAAHTEAPRLATQPVAVAGVDFSAEAKVASLISAYREMGRLIADIDPLTPPAPNHPLLEISNFELSPSDLNRTFTAGRLIGMENAKLSDIIARLREIYCSSIGVEYTHIHDAEARRWLQTRMESSRNREDLPHAERKFILKRLTESETYERFVHTRYVAQKRFSLEGGESLIPLLDRFIEAGADTGVHRLVMGMAHRGRLNVLVNVFGKKPEIVFGEFEENFERLAETGIGDVKYHMGYSSDITTRNGKPIHLTLAHNPSHLEFVNPVVEGIVRSKQRAHGDRERVQVIPILIHGDAAFAGQGVVYETLNLSQLSGYRTGGTLHIVINNQVGFTTDPESSRSTTYATDLAKMLETPIFHVNGDDPEALSFVALMALEFRQKFRKDVFIDLICYRKYGHNEGDEPSYTQPVMYRKIKDHLSTRELYARKLAALGVVTEADSQAMIDQVNERLTECQTISRATKLKPYSNAFESKWKDFHAASTAEVHAVIPTGVKRADLTSIAESLREIPKGFNVHPKLVRFLDGRVQMVRDGKTLDWGTAEALAFGSLIREGHVVRLTGQDAERGTFSHRHSVLNDYETGRKYTPLNTLVPPETNAAFVVRNSHLSETAVLGFEYGWSLADPSTLVIWEAQYGDFANGAQVIIDQFIAASEMKWSRSSGLVMLLPHGYEGGGPEHSSARLERFLQLSAENNFAVCNFTTPAQLFHALRRQVKRPFRKPLVVMSPKSLLRLAACTSTLDDLATGHFQPVLDEVDATVKGANVEKVILCSGKIYYELLEERKTRGLTNVALVRIEELYPWPGDALAAVLNRYPNARLVWAQEEPRNQGAWTHVFNYWGGGLDMFGSQVGNRLPVYVGRPAMAAPANGSNKQHAWTQKKIVETAFSI